MSNARARGFTIIELMVVVVVLGILLMVSLPSYREQLRKTRRSLARAELMQVMARQEQFFLDHRRYAAVLTDLGYPASPYAMDADGNDLSATAPDRIYLVQISTLPGGFYTLSATPQLDQSGDTLCGTLSLNSLGLKQGTGSGSLADCW